MACGGGARGTLVKRARKRRFLHSFLRVDPPKNRSERSHPERKSSVGRMPIPRGSELIAGDVLLQMVANNRLASEDRGCSKANKRAEHTDEEACGTQLADELSESR